LYTGIIQIPGAPVPVARQGQSGGDESAPAVRFVEVLQMKKHTVIAALAFLLPVAPIFAQDFNGEFRAEDTGVIVYLSLEQDGSRVSGAMIAEGAEYSVAGQDEGGAASGLINGYGESMQFFATLEGDELILTLMSAEPVAYGDSQQVFVFQRTGAVAGAGKAPDNMKAGVTAKAGDISVNGQMLSAAEVIELEATYGVRPLPGQYWYDSKSGLYGVQGFQAFGFMYPGHVFESLDENASNGDTGVYVNGRHLPQIEWVTWSQLLGYPIQMGRYWLDANGNAGYEGNPTPTENLYLAAQRNAYGGAGGGDDNTWSTRFSAGNYDQGNTRGYVSVPGYGPVGYGF
jgi:hypothetical protein